MSSGACDATKFVCADNGIKLVALESADTPVAACRHCVTCATIGDYCFTQVGCKLTMPIVAYAVSPPLGIEQPYVALGVLATK